MDSIITKKKFAKREYIYRKRIPYGMMNFVTVRERNCYYVDKTPFIEEIENSNMYFFYIRPRRFGKSLTLSMLKQYYDINMADRFEELFGGLYIGENPTPEHNTYLIISLNFAVVDANLENYKKGLDAHCNTEFNYFCDVYARYLPANLKEEMNKKDGAAEQLDYLCKECKKTGQKVYLFIDEYDHFTNTILAEPDCLNSYQAETHGTGYLRKFFDTIKSATDSTLERVFVTGVSPVTMDDLTSGFNIGWHISTKAPFNQMLGFSTEDVRDLFTYYKNSGDLPADTDVEAIIEDMKPWYDNYCFSEEALRTQSKVFNCDMVLYYLRNYMETGEAPRQMIDPNTKTDYNKMKKLLQLDKLDGDRKGVIMTIAEKGEIVGNIEESFPAKALTNPEIFISLLFYYGMLTIKDTFGDQLILGIPNNNVRKQYYNYLLEQYQEEKYINTSNLKTMFTYMAFEGKWKECLEYMAKAYAEVSSVRDGIEAERNLQGFFMAYFSLNNYYYTAPELELNHGYCDFFLLPNLTHYPTKHSYIIELKVLSKKEFDTLTEDGKMTKGAKQWLDAEEQIKQYAKAPRVEALRQGTTLHKIIMQFKGWELSRIDEVNEI